MKDELQNYQNNTEALQDNKENRIIRSFGRIKSRKLSDHKKLLLEELLPLYEAKNHDFAAEKTCLEIGFGFGDFLFEKAKNNPNILFFGSEPHLNGVVNLLAKLEKEPLPNLRITNSDIRVFFEKFPKNFRGFDQVYILFPDPWPKTKHFKRRLINVEFLDKILAPKMKSDAKLTIATDHDSYKTWILAESLRSKNFHWLANSKKDWQIFPDDWVITKYQRKAEREGRTSVIFNFVHNA